MLLVQQRFILNFFTFSTPKTMDNHKPETERERPEDLHGYKSLRSDLSINYESDRD